MEMTQLKNIKNKTAELKKIIGRQKADLASLQNFFKKYFNEDIVKVGSKGSFNFRVLFQLNSDYKKLFRNKPIQPITVTYIRCDIIFYTYDLHPEMGEQYITFGSDWAKWFYLNEIKQSELWKNKQYLLEKNPNEYYVQVGSFEVEEKFTKLIKDILC